MIRPLLKILIISMFLIFSSHTGANTYDSLLLRAQASIFPRIILLDKHLSEKIPDNIIKLTIVSTAEDNHIAQDLKIFIENKHKSLLGNNGLEVNTTSYKDFNNEQLATAYIVLQGNESSVKSVTDYAYRHQRIVFSYSYTDFQHNALVSLFVKEKTYIYVNKQAIQLYNIKFSPVFYKLIRLIE